MATSSHRDLLVVDLRPALAAWANKAGGGGFEGYAQCDLKFGGIDNIHKVRDAWRAMGSAVNNVTGDGVGSWFKDVAYSSWYDYIGAIIYCARLVVTEIIQYKSNVMVHCSDGWDRTAQTTSLAMLAIDPHYRTQEGFLKLIQKEWCSFGHKFRTRLALGEAPTSEASPVFVQWLEAVYQVVMQSPDSFEFTPSVLLTLASEVSSNRYGTFLTDCERERLQTVRDHTLSLWSVLLSSAELPSWRNPKYQRTEKPIIPSANQACFTIWEAYWFRYHQRGQTLRAAQACGPLAAPEAASAGTEAIPTVKRSGSEGKLNPLNPLAPEPAPDVGHTSDRAEVDKRDKADSLQLFEPQEIVAEPVAKPKAKPKQYFQDDDDDKDPF